MANVVQLYFFFWYIVVVIGTVDVRNFFSKIKKKKTRFKKVPTEKKITFSKIF